MTLSAFLLFGENRSAKDNKIQALKKKYFLTNDAVRFDFDQWQGKKLDAVDLKKSLLALPAVAKKRVVLITMIDKLSNQNKEILLDYFKNGSANAVIILDTDVNEIKSAFYRKIKPYVQFFNYAVGAGPNVFDMTRAISKKQPDQALKILNGLIQDGQHPLMIMGGLVWFWGRMRNQVSADAFKNGLLELQEADLNIKRSRMNANYAVELCVVKLGSLI